PGSPARVHVRTALNGCVSLPPFTIRGGLEMSYRLLQAPANPLDTLPGAEISDGSLMRRFQQGNEEAATILYARYANRVRALAHARCAPELSARIDADDIVQSVFRRFFQAARRGYYDVPAGEELWRVLLVIAL